MHKQEHYKEALVEHLQAREWHEQEIGSFVRMIGSSALMSFQGALNILEYQQAADDLVEAQKDFDEVFTQPELFDEAPKLEVTDISQQFFDRHWKQ